MKAYWKPALFLAAITALVAALGCGDDGSSAPPVNHPPVAAAGANQEVDAGDTVLLDGSGSSDPDGEGLLYHWRQLTGTPVALSDSLATQATFTAPNTSENLAFQLSVTDGRGLGDTDQTNVAVNGTGTPPVANAGADQAVEVNAPQVRLVGTGYDPDGGPVTFAWTQVAGTNVSLDDPTAAATVFAAPAAPTELRFELAVTDTSGSIARDSSTVNVQIAPAPLPPTLFVVGAGNKVYGWTMPGTRDGNVAPDVLVEGAATTLDDPTDVVADATGAVLVSNAAAPRIVSWSVGNQFGDVTPDRSVEGESTGLRLPSTMAIGRSVDVLLVCDAAHGAVGVWDGVSDPDFDGSVAPPRAFWPGPLVLEPTAASYDESADRLYVANRGDPLRGVVVFRFARVQSGTTGDWFANVHESLGDVSDVFHDRHHDRLYMTNGSAGSILVFDDAELMTPQQAPDRVLTIGDNLQAIVVDAQGRGYVADITNRIYRIDDIGSRTGTVTPDATIEGANTQLQAPSQLFLMES